MCTECENNAKQEDKKRPMVGALADIEIRLESCRSLTSCILESLPMPGQGVDLSFYVNEAGNLTAALSDIIDLCREDVKRAYQQLESAD